MAEIWDWLGNLSGSDKVDLLGEGIGLFSSLLGYSQREKAREDANKLLMAQMAGRLGTGGGVVNIRGVPTMLSRGTGPQQFTSPDLARTALAEQRRGEMGAFLGAVGGDYDLEKLFEDNPHIRYLLG